MYQPPEEENNTNNTTDNTNDTDDSGQGGEDEEDEDEDEEEEQERQENDSDDDEDDDTSDTVRVEAKTWLTVISLVLALLGTIMWEDYPSNEEKEVTLNFVTDWGIWNVQMFQVRIIWWDKNWLTIIALVLALLGIIIWEDNPSDEEKEVTFNFVIDWAIWNVQMFQVCIIWWDKNTNDRKGKVVMYKGCWH